MYKSIAASLGLASYTGPIPYRAEASLPFDPAIVTPGATIALDTCAIIDGLKSSLPPLLQSAITQAAVVSSAVVVGELVQGHAVLNPAHPSTAKVAPIIASAIAIAEAIPLQIVPTENHWVEAQAVVATIGRCNSFTKDKRRELVMDALFYVSARDADVRIVTANVRDYDLIDQVAKNGKLLFYKPI
jgi:predicted nucleic acid-binding protein